MPKIRVPTMMQRNNKKLESMRCKPRETKLNENDKKKLLKPRDSEYMPKQ